MRILIGIGTRPEWIKIKPLLSVFKAHNIIYKCLFTGQHKDLLKEHKFDYTLSIPETDINRLNVVAASILNHNIKQSDWDYVLVQGDTISAYALALAAFNNNIQIIHLEAGLRSYDLNHPYPEEAYRQMISRIATINLCPTELSCDHLKAEKVKGDIYNVGNTVLDNIQNTKTSYTNLILVTLHRRENHIILHEWLSIINTLAKEHPELRFVFIKHFNPNVIKRLNILTNVEIIDPLSHDKLIDLLAQVKFVITDSGGLQEEGSFLNKRVIVCRETTERPEGIDTNHLVMCPVFRGLPTIFESVNNNYKINEECPYGDGRSSQKIVNVLLSYEGI
jgi:UDP-N-acetylglucosamine 2-epimerase (non-hydrolysing)